MATVSKEIADDIIAGKYPEDKCFKIVEYTNIGGEQAYGALFEGNHPDTYMETEFVHNPKVYWEAPNAPKYFQATLFIPPNGDKQKVSVMDINPEDARWFTDNNVEVSMEYINLMAIVYATPPGKDPEEDEIMIFSNGRNCNDTMAELRKQCEAGM